MLEGASAQLQLHTPSSKTSGLHESQTHSQHHYKMAAATPKMPPGPPLPSQPKMPAQPPASPGGKPNQSIYIQNLPDKLQKHDLKRNLYILFSTYGSVNDITAMKTMKMRGQAHVLFRDVQSATRAMRECQGFEFFGKEMVSEGFAYSAW